MLLCMKQEEDLGNHFLLQRYQDTPFTVFRFPSSVCLQPLGVATVWSASGAAEECCAGRQLPSSDFIFSSQPIWASGPECITILCKPNEQVRGGRRRNREAQEGTRRGREIHGDAWKERH